VATLLRSLCAALLVIGTSGDAQAQSRPGSLYVVWGEADGRIDAAMDAWARAVPVSWVRAVGACGDEVLRGRICVNVLNGEKWGMGLKEFGMDGAIGFTIGRGAVWDGGNVYVDGDGSAVVLTLEHELGHAMGLEHDVEGTLMHEKSDGSPITCRDVNQWLRRRGWTGRRCGLTSSR
jgi:hypothetical protein